MHVVSPPKKRRWRTWLARLLLAGAALLALAAVFHAPLLRRGIAYAGPKLLEGAGIKLAWQVEGSVLKDLRLSQIEASGSVVDRASIGELAAEYEAWQAVTTGNPDVVRRVVLKRVDAVVDLRRLPAASASAPPKAAGTGQPAPLVWPKVIDFEEVNFQITLADGRQLRVRGLTLQVGPGMPGILRCEECRLEPDGVRVAGVNARVAWGERELTVAGLALPFGAELKALRVDLRAWEQGRAAVALDAAMGPATLALSAVVNGLLGGALQAQAEVRVSDLDSRTLKPLNLPDGVAFGPVRLEMQAQGNPQQPASLTAAAQLRVPDVTAAGARLQAVTLDVEVKDGVARLRQARLVGGANEVTAEAEARLAEDLLRSPWTAQVKARVADLAAVLTDPPPATGRLELLATASGVGATPTQAKAQIAGTELGWAGRRLPKLALEVALDGREATLRLPELQLGAGNTFQLEAAMTMDEAMPVTASWNLRVHDPAALLRTVRQPDLPQPLKARLEARGRAAFPVNAPLAVEADLALQLDEGRWGEAPLPGIRLQARAARGEAVIETCQVVVDADNRIDLKGRMGLAAPWPLQAGGEVTLPELTSLNTLLEALRLPKVQAGRLAAKLALQGQAQPWRSEGRVDLQAGEVRMDGLPEPVSMELRTAFTGATARIEALQAALGPWKLLARGEVDAAVAHLSELSFWQKERRLLSGHVRAPLDLMQAGAASATGLDVRLVAEALPVHEIAAAAGLSRVPEALVSSELVLGGRLDSAAMDLKLRLKDVKLPDAPKPLQPAQAEITAVLKDQRLRVEVALRQAPLQPLTLKAELPVALADLVRQPAAARSLPVQASLDLPESDLSVLREFAPQLLKSVPAKLRLQARVAGTLDAPRIDSQLVLDAPEIGFAGADLPSVRNVRVRLRSEDRRIVLEDLSALLAGGRVRLTGTLEAASLEQPRLDLRLEAREALVFRNPTSSLRANADLRCAGTLQAAHVSGQVETVRGRIFQEVNLLPNVMGVVRQGDPLPPPPPPTAKTNARLELPPLLKEWTFDVKVRTRDPVLLAGNLVNGAVSADLALGGTGAQPKLTGGANVDRLLLKLPFSLLKITKGVVTMNPENPLAPNLDVRGESRIGSHDITLYVYGDATQPKTRFTSTPPLSEADIVTLIGTGMTLGGDNAQMASEAMTRAAFLVLAETYRKVFNRKKTVSAEPPKLHMSFNPSGGDRANDSMQAMYELTPKLRVIGKFTQSGRMKALLGYVLRFGQAARAVEEDSPP